MKKLLILLLVLISVKSQSQIFAAPSLSKRGFNLEIGTIEKHNITISTDLGFSFTGNPDAPTIFDLKIGKLIDLNPNSENIHFIVSPSFGAGVNVFKTNLLAGQFSEEFHRKFEYDIVEKYKTVELNLLYRLELGAQFDWWGVFVFVNQCKVKSVGVGFKFVMPKKESY